MLIPEIENSDLPNTLKKVIQFTFGLIKASTDAIQSPFEIVSVNTEMPVRVETLNMVYYFSDNDSSHRIKGKYVSSNKYDIGEYIFHTGELPYHAESIYDYYYEVETIKPDRYQVIRYEPVIQDLTKHDFKDKTIAFKELCTHSITKLSEFLSAHKVDLDWYTFDSHLPYTELEKLGVYKPVLPTELDLTLLEKYLPTFYKLPEEYASQFYTYCKNNNLHAKIVKHFLDYADADYKEWLLKHYWEEYLL